MIVCKYSFQLEFLTLFDPPVGVKCVTGSTFKRDKRASDVVCVSFDTSASQRTHKFLPPPQRKKMLQTLQRVQLMSKRAASICAAVNPSALKPFRLDCLHGDGASAGYEPDY